MSTSPSWGQGKREAQQGYFSNKARKMGKWRRAEATNSETEQAWREKPAVALASRQMPVKAISRLIDPGLAPDTREVEQVMRAYTPIGHMEFVRASRQRVCVHVSRAGR